MKKHLIPPVYFPTQTLFIDDDDDFLNRLQNLLSQSPQNKHNIYTTSTEEALNAMNDLTTQRALLKRCFEFIDNQFYEHKVIDSRVQNFFELLYEPIRYSLLTVVFIDYSMPEKNGLELCAEINNPYIKKVLLTGEADESIAVSAFNDKLIDGYLKKDALDLSTSLPQLIDKFSKAYFTEMLRTAIDSMTSFDGTTSAVNDPEFVKHFNEIVKDNNIVEFYQFESLGSFIMVDDKGELFSLFTYNKDKVDADRLEVEDADDELPIDVRDQISKAKQLLCIHQSDEVFNMPKIHDWPEYLRPAKTIEGRDTYYYAFEKGGININSDKIKLNIKK